MACYDYALNLDKRSRFTVVRRGLVLAKMDRHEEAVRAFDRALEMSHRDVDVLTAKRRSLLELDRVEESIKVSEKIVHLDPKNVEAYMDLGIAYHRMGNYKKALANYNKALALEPGDIHAWDLKRLTVIALDDPEEIIRTCDEILALDPGNKAAMLDKVNELERLGQLGPAADTLQRAFEPFFTTRTFGRHSGLGLSAVYGIVTQNGGWVTLESTNGAGTTAAFYLPRLAGAAPAAPHP